MKKKVVIAASVIALAIGGGGLFHSTYPNLFQKAVAAPAPPAPVPVVAAAVAQKDLPIYLNGVGTVIAYNTDVVRAQIQGQITSINFTEGQQVHAGDLLAQIDPRPYQALIDETRRSSPTPKPISSATPNWEAMAGRRLSWSRPRPRKSVSCARLSRPTRP
jgi:multidrug efflux system membrane fusion protein